MKEKKLIVIYTELDGTIHPISILYSHFFLGVDTIAVLSNDNHTEIAIKEVKQLKPKWKSISQDGKFHIINLDRPHNFSIKLHTLKGSNLSHRLGGKIGRENICSINGLPIDDYIKKLKENKQLGMA